MRGQERPAATRHQALEALERMMREGLGLRLLLGKLPDGATLDDARALRRRILQSGRRPSRALAPGVGAERA